MTFTYVLANLGSDNNTQIRYLMGDNVLGKGVKPDNSNFQDEEITYMLAASGGEIYEACAELCLTLATLYSNVVDLSVGGRNENLSKIADNWVLRAAEFRKRGEGGGVETFGIRRVSGWNEDYPSDATPLNSLHNPYSGEF
jgi:hypothetical protein